MGCFETTSTYLSSFGLGTFKQRRQLKVEQNVGLNYLSQAGQVLAVPSFFRIVYWRSIVPQLSGGRKISLLLDQLYLMCARLWSLSALFLGLGKPVSICLFAFIFQNKNDICILYAFFTVPVA